VSWFLFNNTQGVRNKEYSKLIPQLQNTKIFCVDEETIEQRDKKIAENIQRIPGRVVAILGNIHASKKKITINKTTITPTGYYLRKQAYSINITTTKEPKEYFDTTIRLSSNNN